MNVNYLSVIHFRMFRNNEMEEWESASMILARKILEKSLNVLSYETKINRKLYICSESIQNQK